MVALTPYSAQVNWNGFSRMTTTIRYAASASDMYRKPWNAQNLRHTTASECDTHMIQMVPKKATEMASGSQPTSRMSGLVSLPAR